MEYQVTVIIPALNEEFCIAGAIQNVVDAYKKLSVHGEIIVINDGSSDNTLEIAETIAQSFSNILIISHNDPKGIGSSFWEGVRKSHGEMVTIIPGDNEVDSYEILRYLPLMDEVDIIVPFFFNPQVRSLKRRIISKSYKAIINLSFCILLNYMNGTVMYRKSILENITLQNTGFFYQTELLIKCLKNDYLFAEVPCKLDLRENGTSTALSYGNFIKVISGYLSTLWAIYNPFNKQNKIKIVKNSVTAHRRELFKNSEKK